MASRRRPFAVLLLTLALATEARAQYELFDDYHLRSALEAELLHDLEDGAIDEHSLIRASLIAAGHLDEAAIQATEGRYRDYVASCGKLLDPEDGLRDRAGTVFRFMHSEILRGDFNTDLFDLANTISEGHYNCLSATILFQSLCQEFSLPVRAIWQPAHVRCWISESEYEGLAVETTTPQWHHAQSARQVITNLPARCLNEAELIGKVFYNRGVEALRRRCFSTALAATCASCQLDAEDDQAQSNLRACLNNWALEAALTGDLDTARDLLEAGMRFDPDYSPFSRNRSFVRRMLPET